MRNDHERCGVGPERLHAPKAWPREDSFLHLFGCDGHLFPLARIDGKPRHAKELFGALRLDTSCGQTPQRSLESGNSLLQQLSCLHVIFMLLSIHPRRILVALMLLLIHHGEVLHALLLLAGALAHLLLLHAVDFSDSFDIFLLLPVVLFRPFLLQEAHLCDLSDALLLLAVHLDDSLLGLLLHLDHLLQHGYSLILAPLHATMHLVVIVLWTIKQRGLACRALVRVVTTPLLTRGFLFVFLLR
jgi:hypothetical protein